MPADNIASFFEKESPVIDVATLSLAVDSSSVRVATADIKAWNYGDSALILSNGGLGFAAATSRLEDGAGEVFESVEKVGIADGAADAFGAAKCGKGRLFFSGGEEGGEIGKASANRCRGRDAVILNQSKLGSDTRPPPIGSPFDKACAHRIEGDVTERCRQMFFIHGDTTEATLPEMAGPAQPCMDMAGIGAMNAR